MNLHDVEMLASLMFNASLLVVLWCAHFDMPDHGCSGSGGSGYHAGNVR